MSYPLTGQVFMPALDDRATESIFIELDTGEDAQLFTLAVGNSGRAIPDYLTHKLLETIRSGRYPGVAEEYKEGRLLINSPLTLEQALEQWTAMGLRLESSDYEVSGAMAAYESTQMAAASKAELATTTTANDAQVATLTDQVAKLTALVTQMTSQSTAPVPPSVPAPNPPIEVPPADDDITIDLPPPPAPSKTNRRTLAV